MSQSVVVLTPFETLAQREERLRDAEIARVFCERYDRGEQLPATCLCGCGATVSEGDALTLRCAERLNKNK